MGRQYFSSKVTYPGQATVTHVDGGQFIVRKGDRVRLLWSEMGGAHLTQVESRTCCFKRDWRKGRFVRPLTTVWGDQNSLGGDFITAASRLAGVYPPWFSYEFEGAAPGRVVEMVFVGGKWEVISVQNRKDVYGQTGQWLQVGMDLRGYDAEYQAAARGIRQKTLFVRAERAMGVDSWWGATLECAEWRAEHLVAPSGKKTIKTQDKSVYDRVKDRVYGHVICRVDGRAIKLVVGGGGTGGGMGHWISVIAECSKDLRGKSSWFLLVWEAGSLDSPRAGGSVRWWWTGRLLRYLICSRGSSIGERARPSGPPAVLSLMSSRQRGLLSMGVRTFARLQQQIFLKSSFVWGCCRCREQG